MLVRHVRLIIKLPIGQAVDRRRDEWVELHVASGLFWLFQPFLPTDDEEDGKNRRLHHPSPIRFLYTDIREITDLQGFDEIRHIDGMSTRN